MDEKIFYDHLKKYLNDEEIDKLKKSLEESQEYSCLILDTEKLSRDKLLELYPNLISHPIVDDAFLFKKNEYDLGKSLLFEIGAFYILEPCSPLVSHFLNLKEDDLVLDMAAAPGGKCIHASFCMKNKGQILANEISSSRAEILSSNCEKYGRRNIIVCSSDTYELKKQFPNTFNKIILDAPCSGSGMFRKEKKMKDDWTIEKVLKLSSLQKELILQAYFMLNEGGTLIYSTCSFSYEEDEEVIQYLLDNTDAILEMIPHFDGEYRSNMDKTIHLLPSHFIGEGHFIAKIRKPGNLVTKIISEREYISKDFKFKRLYKNSDDILYLCNELIPLKRIRRLRSGIKIGEENKKRGIIFDHAISRHYPPLIQSIEVNEKEAKDFIFGLPLNKDCPSGYVILTYQNIPFALGKASNKVIKNHYPKGLRKRC